MREKMKTMLKNGKKKMICLGMAAQLLVMTNPITVYATKGGGGGSHEAASDASGGSLGSSQFVTGLKNLISDASTVLLVVEGTLIVALEIMEGIKYQSAPDEEKPKHKKAMKSILGVGILIVSFTALIPIILGYFK